MGKSGFIASEPATLEDVQSLADSCYKRLQEPPDWAIAILAAHPPVITGSDPADPDAARRARLNKRTCVDGRRRGAAR